MTWPAGRSGLCHNTPSLARRSPDGRPGRPGQVNRLVMSATGLLFTLLSCSLSIGTCLRV